MGVRGSVEAGPRLGGWQLVPLWSASSCAHVHTHLSHLCLHMREFSSVYLCACVHVGTRVRGSVSQALFSPRPLFAPPQVALPLPVCVPSAAGVGAEAEGSPRSSEDPEAGHVSSSQPERQEGCPWGLGAGQTPPRLPSSPADVRQGPCRKAGLIYFT